MIDARTENNIKNISMCTAQIAEDVHDIAVSLQILSGRTSLKKYALEKKVNTLEATIRHMKKEALVFGDENGTKIQKLESSLKQTTAALNAEEERIFNEINK